MSRSAERGPPAPGAAGAADQGVGEEKRTGLQHAVPDALQRAWRRHRARVLLHSGSLREAKELLLLVDSADTDTGEGDDTGEGMKERQGGESIG